MTRISANGNGSRLVYWILGALISLVGFISAIAHQMMIRQLETLERHGAEHMLLIEKRLDKLEDKPCAALEPASAPWVTQRVEVQRAARLP